MTNKTSEAVLTAENADQAAKLETKVRHLEEAQANAAHAAGEFLDVCTPDEGEPTVKVSKEALDNLRTAIAEWNAASNAFLAAHNPPRERRPTEDQRHDPEI